MPLLVSALLPAATADHRDDGAQQEHLYKPCPVRNGLRRLQADFFSMLSTGRRGAAGGAEGTARGAVATGPHVAVARELLDLIEFSIGALRRQVHSRSGPGLGFNFWVKGGSGYGD